MDRFSLFNNDILSRKENECIEAGIPHTRLTKYCVCDNNCCKNENGLWVEMPKYIPEVNIHSKKSMAPYYIYIGIIFIFVLFVLVSVG